MMTIASKEISNELMNAYKAHKMVMIELKGQKMTGTVAAVNDNQAFINRPGKQVTVINLDDIVKVTVLG